MLHKTHDLGELGLDADVLHGLKTDNDRERETERFLGHADRVRETDPTLYARLGWVLHTSDQHQDTQAGRLWKNAVEHVGFMETARRLHERFVVGSERPEAVINHDTGMYLDHSYQLGPDRRPHKPALIGTQALVADLLANSGEAALRAAKEFLSMRQYLWRHQDQYRQLYTNYLLDAEHNETLIAEIRSLKEYTVAAAEQHRTRQEASKAMMAYLDHLQGYSLDEALALRYDGLTPLADGRMVEVTS